MSRQLKRLAAVFLIGVLAGGAVISALMGKQIDSLALANISLREQLSATERELQQVKENLKTHRTQVINTLKVQVLLPANQEESSKYLQGKIQLSVENKVQEWLQPVLGQDFTTLNHLLIPQVIDKRQVEVDGRTYVLKVKLVVVGCQTVIYLEAVPEKNQVRD